MWKTGSIILKPRYANDHTLLVDELSELASYASKQSYSSELSPEQREWWRGRSGGINSAIKLLIDPNHDLEELKTASWPSDIVLK